MNNKNDGEMTLNKAIRNQARSYLKREMRKLVGRQLPWEIPGPRSEREEFLARAFESLVDLKTEHLLLGRAIKEAKTRPRVNSLEN